MSKYYDELIALAERKEAFVESMEREYGTGVRPSSVGHDIMIAYVMAMEYRKSAAELLEKGK